MIMTRNSFLYNSLLWIISIFCIVACDNAIPDSDAYSYGGQQPVIGHYCSAYLFANDGFFMTASWFRNDKGQALRLIPGSYIKLSFSSLWGWCDYFKTNVPLFNELSKRYNDIGYTESPKAKLLADDIIGADVISQDDFDVRHKKGASLADILMIRQYSAYDFLMGGYKPLKSSELSYCQVSRDLICDGFSKPLKLSLCSAEIYLDPNYSEKPYKGEHPVDIVFYFEGNIEKRTTGKIVIY